METNLVSAGNLSLLAGDGGGGGVLAREIFTADERCEHVGQIRRQAGNRCGLLLSL